MPVASTSRRTRRQLPEDISEDPISQRSKAEDVDVDSEDDAAPRRRKSRKEKRDKGKGKAAPDDDENVIDVDLDVVEIPDQPFDREAFLNQPLTQKQLSKLHSLASDADVALRGYKPDVMEIVKTLAGNMTEFLRKNQDKALEKLDENMRTLIDIEQHHYLQRDVVSSFHERLTKGDDIENVVTQFEKNLKEKIEEYEAKTSRQKYLKNEDYKEFKEAIFQVDHKDEAMPPMTTFIEKEPGDVSDDDDDVEVGGVTQDYKCPITLTPLQQPMTSRKCKHSFSRDSIREYLANGPQRCPATGCNQKVSSSDLYEDKALERRVREHARREAMRAEDEDVDAEIID